MPSRLLAMQIAERQPSLNQGRSPAADLDEAIDLIGSGEVRDALKALMRSLPDDLKRSPSKGATSRRVPAFLTGLCYALMGMYSDAAEWCKSGEGGASAAGEKDADRAKKACLLLWCRIGEGDLKAAMMLALDLLSSKDLAGDLLLSVVAATVVLALKLEDLALASDIAALVGEPGPGALAHTGAALLDLCRAELRFREILYAMPELSGSLGAAVDARSERAALDRLMLARRAGTLAAQIERLEQRLRPWPLLEQLALTTRLASEALALQFLGRTVDLCALEMQVSSFHNRGLVPLHRHGRFLLALLNLHQLRPATAQNWLASALSSEIETREHLLAANVRVLTQDWSHAFALYRRYVSLAAAQARTAGELRARMAQLSGPKPPQAGFGGSSQRSRPLESDAIQANESRFFNNVRQLHWRQTDALAKSQTAEAIRRLIEEDLAQPLLVREIAARLGVARRTLENRIRLESSLSVKRFVTALRLEHAHRLVHEGAPLNAQSLQAIAAQVGFPSYRTFCAAYTRSFGRITHRRGRS